MNDTARHPAVPAALSASQRLRQLEEIAAGSRAGLTLGGPDVLRQQLDDVVERIRKMTAFLTQPNGAADEDVDRLAMRLLLNDYVAAVTRMRVMAREAGTRLDAADETVAELRPIVSHDAKLSASVHEMRVALDDDSPARPQGD